MINSIHISISGKINQKNFSNSTKRTPFTRPLLSRQKSILAYFSKNLYMKQAISQNFQKFKGLTLNHTPNSQPRPLFPPSFLSKQVSIHSMLSFSISPYSSPKCETPIRVFLKVVLGIEFRSVFICLMYFQTCKKISI